MDKPPRPGEARIERVDEDRLRVVWTSAVDHTLWATTCTLRQLAAIENGEVPEGLETPEYWRLDEQIEVVRAAGDHMRREMEAMERQFPGIGDGEWDRGE